MIHIHSTAASGAEAAVVKFMNSWVGNFYKLIAFTPRERFNDIGPLGDIKGKIIESHATRIESANIDAIKNSDCAIIYKIGRHPPSVKNTIKRCRGNNVNYHFINEMNHDDMISACKWICENNFSNIFITGPRSSERPDAEASFRPIVGDLLSYIYIYFIWGEGIWQKRT